jgi:hypothetical protein
LVKPTRNRPEAVILKYGNMRSAAAAIVTCAMMLTPGTAFASDPIGRTIVINEAHTWGPMGTADEYIELQNVSGTAIDISDYRLRFTEPEKSPVQFAKFPKGGWVVEPGEFFLYTGVVYGGPWCGGLIGQYDLPDTGIISLHKPTGEVVASIGVPQEPAERSACE